MAKALNPKQLKFVERYLATGNATQSYIDAGYKARGKSAGNAASVLLENDGVKAALDAARASAVVTAELTAEYVIKGLKTEAEYVGEGAQHSARIKAYELLGKAVKLWPKEGQDSAETDDKGTAVELLTRILAALGARTPGPVGGGPGGTAGEPAVVPEPRPPEPGVPQ